MKTTCIVDSAPAGQPDAIPGPRRYRCTTEGTDLSTRLSLCIGAHVMLTETLYGGTLNVKKIRSSHFLSFHSIITGIIRQKTRDAYPRIRVRDINPWHSYSSYLGFADHRSTCDSNLWPCRVSSHLWLPHAELHCKAPSSINLLRDFAVMWPLEPLNYNPQTPLA
jgi:hypothetical protein